MKLKTCAFVCLVIGFTILCGCQTDADREKDARRLRELGSRSISEFCTDPSFSEAKEIAKRGSGLAGVLVASCYEQGAGGVRADLDEAMKWYRKAQEGGYQPAANSIESLKACIAAKGPAEHGDKKQASVFAGCFENGEGGPKDIVESRKWDLIAGPENERLTSRYNLIPDQEAEARKRFAAFRTK